MRLQIVVMMQQTHIKNFLDKDAESEMSKELHALIRRHFLFIFGCDSGLCFRCSKMIFKGINIKWELLFWKP